MSTQITSIDEVKALLADNGYVCKEASDHSSLLLPRPLDDEIAEDKVLEVYINALLQNHCTGWQMTHGCLICHIEQSDLTTVFKWI